MIPVCREGHEHQKRRGATPARSALPPEVEKASKLHNEDQKTQHLAKPRSWQALGVLEREHTAILLFFPVCGMMTTHIYLKFPMVDKTPVVKDDWQDTGRVGGSREEPNNLCTPIIEDWLESVK